MAQIDAIFDGLEKERKSLQDTTEHIGLVETGPLLRWGARCVKAYAALQAQRTQDYGSMFYMLDFMNDLLIDIYLEQNKHTQMQQVVHNRVIKNIKVPFLLLMQLNHFLRDVIV